jgi:hypothetical protein
MPSSNLAVIHHFLSFGIYYLDLPTFETLFILDPLSSYRGIFLHFRKDSGMLVWYNMLNTIPGPAQTSHSEKCSNNTEYGKLHWCSLIWIGVWHP